MADSTGIYKEKVLKCSDYPGLRDAARAYLEFARPGTPPQTASVAIAGPVSGDRFEMTNHLWNFSVEETRRDLGLQSRLITWDTKQYTPGGAVYQDSGGGGGEGGGLFQRLGGCLQ